MRCANCEGAAQLERSMLEKPKFLQGVYEFEGQGLQSARPFAPAPLRYKVPFDRRAQLIYFRGGNSCEAMIYLLLLRNGSPMRYFPIGAQGAIHVPLAVVEDLHPDTELEIEIAAPAGVKGTVVIDVGLTEF